MDDVPPIVVGPHGVLIPHGYLNHATEFEIELTDGYVLVRPKRNGDAVPTGSSEPARFPWIGISRTKDPTASQRLS